MKYYKIVKDRYIKNIGEGKTETKLFTPITEEKNKELEAKIKNKPEDTLERKYKLSNETEEYISVETTHEEKVEWYVKEIENKTLTLEDVPEEYRTDVVELINSNSAESANKYGVPDETLQQIQDDTIANLIELGVL